MRRAAIVLLIAGISVMAQGTESKRKLSEWPVSAKAAKVDVGAEFMVRLVSYGRESFVTDNFLVVEVAVYATPENQVDLRLPMFTMRVNGRKDILQAQPPSAVISYIRYPAWEQPPAGPQIGDVGERFPGDPRARTPRLPRAPGQPEDSVPETRMSTSDVINKSSLPEGPRKTVGSGYLFFPWKGNPEKLKSVELTVTMPSADPVTLRLR